MPPVSLTSMWRRLWKPSAASGTVFRRWEVARGTKDISKWMVSEEATHRVVCLAFSQAEAEQIASAHNRQDPIKSRQDWLEARNP